MNTFASRLKKLMDEKQIGQTQLAMMCKKYPGTERLGQATIHNIFKKESSSSQYITQIAAALEVDAYWLATGENLDKPVAEVELIEVVNQSSFMQYYAERNPELVIEHTTCKSPVDHGTFAIRLSDDSMESTIDFASSLPMTSDVVIQTNQKILKHGDFALVILAGTSTPIVRQLIEVGRDRMWRPFNTMYRHEEVGEHDQIIGRITEKLGSLI